MAMCSHVETKLSELSYMCSILNIMLQAFHVTNDLLKTHNRYCSVVSKIIEENFEK